MGDDLYERRPAVVAYSAEIWPDREVKPKEKTISRADSIQEVLTAF